METMLGQDYQDCTALHIEYGSLTHCTTAASVILFAVRFPSWLLRSSLLARYRCAAAARLFIPCPLQNPLLASPLLMHFNLSFFSNYSTTSNWYYHTCATLTSICSPTNCYHYGPTRKGSSAYQRRRKASTSRSCISTRCRQ